MRSAIILLFSFVLLNSIQAVDDFRFGLSPNPASNSVTIETEIAVNDIKIEVFSILGDKILEQTFKESAGKRSFVVNTQAIPDGIYLVRVSFGSHVSVKRLKIQHG